MKFEAELVDDVAVLILSGELDSRGNAQLEKILRDLAAKNIFKVVLDISNIRFIGSHTVSMLISNMKEMRAGGGNIKLLNPQKTVLQYLKQNRMIEFFDVYRTRWEAVASYTQKSSTSSPNSKGSQPSSQPTDNLIPTISKTETGESIESRFETGEVLYTNSCMLASLIKTLQSKGLLTSEEANELLSDARESLKGAAE